MRIMGLDVGERTIGIAVSDPLGWTAQGVDTIRRKGDLKEDLDHLKLVLDEYEVEEIVVGLPKNMNGTLGPSAVRAQEIADVIAQETGLPIKMWDERLSTMAAEKTLLEGNVSRAKRKKVIDKMAAVIILQSYLDFYANQKS
ncbi:Holliday junction resolvase RuvX [Dehalobacterium formicoaceticum]|uniref:Putative pre-16S rRNA nuclease n=1 Tax=Dehalobacterium formicoaceticum TaxID=51515 RepID=A0ABT1Y8G8_9FIRM|nr:Holliday junction resolvase RuvX [Dehalobacterium formicoaceticum]MCR6546781.1 Holliday junction resolvase RuvX [Dehalobacterium formicoaceticum]